MADGFFLLVAEFHKLPFLFPWRLAEIVIRLQALNKGQRTEYDFDKMGNSVFSEWDPFQFANGWRSAIDRGLM